MQYITLCQSLIISTEKQPCCHVQRITEHFFLRLLDKKGQHVNKIIRIIYNNR